MYEFPFGNMVVSIADSRTSRTWCPTDHRRSCEVRSCSALPADPRPLLTNRTQSLPVVDVSRQTAGRRCRHPWTPSFRLKPRILNLHLAKLNGRMRRRTSCIGFSVYAPTSLASGRVHTSLGRDNRHESPCRHANGRTFHPTSLNGIASFCSSPLTATVKKQDGQSVSQAHTAGTS